MKKKLLELNNAVLFACASMYFGTGWSEVLFYFPIAPKLNVNNYYLVFIDPVLNAAKFFTYMTILMCILATIMIVAEWRTRYRWYPIIVLLATIAATALTMILIFPLNHALEAGITDPAEFNVVLPKWMQLNWVRNSFWSVEWVAMMVYYAKRSYQLRTEK